MRLRHWLPAVLPALALLLTACVEDYDRDDVRRLVEEQYDLSKVTVSAVAREVVDTDGYTDYLWTVTTQEGLVFHVLDDHYWGMESAANALRCDYEAVVLRTAYPQYSGPLALDVDDSGPLVEVRLTADFATRAELETLLDAEQALAAWAQGQGLTVPLPVTLSMQNPLRTRTDYLVDDGDSYGTLYYDPEAGRYNLPDRAAALRDFLLTCLDYRFTGPLADFTPDEIRTALQEQRDFCALALSPSGDTDGPFVPYDDLCASLYGYGVSFGTLYEVLVRSGFAPEGDAWHYTFTGTDGSVYEISYDFVGLPYDTAAGRQIGYYYFKDGQQTAMDAYFYNHFRMSEVREMTGLVLDTGSWADFAAPDGAA